MKLSYLKVESFQDLLDRNMDYLEGRLDFNPYTHAKISDDVDMVALVPKLIAVTKLGFYTITGQPAKAAYNVLDPKKGLYVSVEQRNYTSGWLQESVAVGLEAWLKASRYKHDVYYRIDFDNKEKGYFVQQNMPYNVKKCFNLSRFYETPTSHASVVPIRDQHVRFSLSLSLSFLFLCFSCVFRALLMSQYKSYLTPPPPPPPPSPFT